MTTTSVQKKEKSERPYLHLVRPTRTPEQLLDLEWNEEVGGIEIGAGHERPRRLYKLAAGELFPVRIAARVIDDALAVGADAIALFLAVCGPLQRYIERKSRQKLAPRLPRRHEYKRLPSGGPEAAS